jgi:cytochrome c
MRIALSLILALAASPALAATGQDLFNDKCAECHTVDGTSLTAPTLKGVVGRKIASLPDYQYSPALKAKQGGEWTEQALDTFLFNPRGFAPGTEMFVGAPDPKERGAIIAYLKTVK